MVKYIITTLLQIARRVWRWNNFENRPIGKNMGKSKVPRFYGPRCSVVKRLLRCDTRFPFRIMYDDASIAIAVGFLGKGRFKLIGLSWAAPKGGGWEEQGNSCPRALAHRSCPPKKLMVSTAPAVWALYHAKTWLIKGHFLQDKTVSFLCFPILKSRQTWASIARPKAKRLKLQGGFTPWPPDQGLCPRTPLHFSMHTTTE